ncbi:MAG TPA: flagellar filament capping protein FliD, partial [Phycisphaerales bacterium]|nr:flagellar filament capping protein FliD [Phycisphaerales bacterium]
MGTITTGVGLISGINTAQLIDQLISIESQGKVTLQNRVALLQTQQTAILDINARLLNLKTAASAFRTNKIFDSVLAQSSNEDTLTATATTSAQPGTYQFIVKQLVSTSQKLSKGFANTNTTPLGLDQLSFEFGKGALQTDKDLADLNGGAGVDRGKIDITDRNGTKATIDLTDVTTLNEVIDRINTNTTIGVTASIQGDHLVLTDTTSGSGTLTVASRQGDTTAEDLGIAGTGTGATLTGSNINTIGLDTALRTLNDGTGVLVRNGVPDIRITARDGTAIDVDFGRVNEPITGATLLENLNNGSGITLNGSEDDPDIRFITRDGTTHDVNLHGVTTVQGLIDRVNLETSGAVTLSVTGGTKFTVTDTTAGSGLLKIQGVGPNGTKTAKDLGILNTTGVAANTYAGSVIQNSVNDPAATTVSDIINRINNATGNGGKIVASLGADGVSLQLTDTTGGGGNLIVASTVSNPNAASDLGIATDPAGVASSTVSGSRLVAGLGSVLVNHLNGGSGLGTASAITFTDRSGASFSLSNLDTYESLTDIVNAINTAATSNGVDVTVGFNDAGNGLKVTDSSGGTGNLTISGDAADALGITADVASTSVRGTNLQLKYVADSSLLSDLNYGRGVGTGKFKITDGTGESATIDIASDSTSLYDVIQEINSRGLAVTARVNDHGDGIVIEENLGPGQVATQKIKVESVSGSTAKDLNIIGTASEIGGSIDGSYERTVDLTVGDTLAKVVDKINKAGIPVSASIVNTGSGSSPYRLNLTSGISGRLGELLIDSGDVDLGLTTLAKGQDAKVFFGAGDAENGFLVTSSTNSVTGVVQGVTLDLHQASTDPVTVTINRDTDSILTAVQRFVTNFNDAVGRIDQYDYYNADTEQKGPLLGDATTARVREALFAAIQKPATGVTSQYKYLRQVGITIGGDGKLQFDQDKFDSAYETDPDAVESLFAAFESSTTSSEEISPGITVQKTSTQVTTSGLGDIFNSLLDSLTNSVDGVLTVAKNNYDDMIK